MNEESKNNYYAIIPATVRYNKDLKPNEKLLYGEITALANSKGFCFASNRYFAELYKVTIHTVSQWISHLEKLGYVNIELIKDDKKEIKERRIYISDTPYIQKDTYPYVLKSTYPIYKKVQDNLRDGLPYPYTEQDGKDFISAMLSADENETFAFAITVDNIAVGSIGVYRQGNIHRRTAELGYYIAEEYWGKGIMTEAVRKICEYVFGKSDIIRIYAEPFAYNKASCRVLEKAGFQYEGTLRSNAVKNGKVIDMKMYSLIKEE